MNALSFNDLGNGNITCTLNLAALYPDTKTLDAFNKRWSEFLEADEGHAQVLSRKEDVITYPHKSWLPEKENGKPSLLLLFGNPAPHSVVKDIYFAYEGKGTEHRFWKVLRELGFTDLYGNDADIKTKFLNLDHASPFRLGFEVIYTFPSSASKPKWSGVAGVERLFGKSATAIILQAEKQRLSQVIDGFMKDGGAIVALQKDAYNAVSQNQYSLSQAAEGTLVSTYESVPVYGTPPTRWLYTTKMKGLLTDIKERLVTA
jgi:hypothetical protein